MPKLFRVTIEKKMELTFVAESKDELDNALDNADFDDWDTDGWDYHIIDMLDPRRPGMIPDEVPEIDMGVIENDDGLDAVNIGDYADDHPDYMAQVKAALAEAHAAVEQIRKEKREKADTEPPDVK